MQLFSAALMLDDDTHPMFLGGRSATWLRYLHCVTVAGRLLAARFFMFGLSQFRRNCAAQNTVLAPEAAPAQSDRIFVLVPHCDDETLGCGGFLHAARKRGLAVQVAFTTHGDGSRSMQIAETMRRLQTRDFQSLAALRRREAISACARLGIEEQNVLFLGYPDGGTGKLWASHWNREYRSPFTRASRVPYADAQTPGAPYCGAALLQDVRALLQEFRPTLILTTHRADTHSDHRACWAFAFAALESLRLGGSDWAAVTQMRAFLVHRGVWPAPHGYHPTKKLAPPADLLLPFPARRWTSWDLDEAASAAKKSALEQHDSQLAWTPLYLRGFLRRNEIFETIARADEETNTSVHAEKARGVSLLACDATSATLRVHLRVAPSGFGGGFIELHLHAVGASTTRVWRIEIDPLRTKKGGTRARETTGDSARFSFWHSSSHAAGFDVVVPLDALAPLDTPDNPLGFSLFVSASFSTQRRRSKKSDTLSDNEQAQMGRAQEQTEIGVVRLANFGRDSAPLLVAPSDPRTVKIIPARRR